VHLFYRYFSLILVVSYLAAYLIGTILPGWGVWILHAKLGSVDAFGGKLVFSLPLLMAATFFFNIGLRVNAAEWLHLFSKPTLLMGGVVGTFLTPLIFIGSVCILMRFWDDSVEMQEILVGMALIASMPIAGASTFWTQNANGNLALSLGLVLLTTFLSPLRSPLVLHAGGFATEGDYSDDLHALASGVAMYFLGIWVILPSLFGILVRRLMRESHFEKLKPVLLLTNYIVLILFEYANASHYLPPLLSQPDMYFSVMILVIVTTLSLAAFTSGHLMAKLFRADRNSKVSLMFGMGMNNSAIGLVLASMVWVDYSQVMLPIIFYELVQQLVASVVNFSMFRKQGERAGDMGSAIIRRNDLQSKPGEPAISVLAGSS
jgi:BASS family bile acid:Na+ symporter